ncbi:MAG: putative esterase of the alpha-beta hydrolase superfamily [Haloplasmataceae bacterium]|nr:putative esterase of the alpha-beta hydrolase superfamily [Haloplasmataceae bacterium]
MEKQNKVALVVEGGAMRGIFSAGILDAFIEHDYNPFDLCIGVSAGANNITTLLAGMYQRSYKVYTDYNLRKDFINWKKFLKGGHYLDLDWLWDITLKEIPLNTSKVLSSKSEFYVGITEVKTGKIKYVKPNEDNIENVLKASSCIPIFYRDFIRINDEFYVDGGIADPIPIKEAVNQGAKIIVVLRSRPYSFTIKHRKTHFMTNVLFIKYPQLKKSLKMRSETYHESIEFMRNNKDVNIIEVNPPDTFKTKRLTKELNILESDYHCGYEMGLKLIKQLNVFL